VAEERYGTVIPVVSILDEARKKRNDGDRALVGEDGTLSLADET
jgi:hypothetical protein